jgi:hypothetical protein
VLGAEDDDGVYPQRIEHAPHVNEPAIYRGRMSKQPDPDRAQLRAEVRMGGESIEPGSHAVGEDYRM